MAPISGGATSNRSALWWSWGSALLRRGGVIASLVLLASFALVGTAGAHGGDETEEGYLLVQQALGHLEHETNHEGIALAMEKVDDALAAEDQEGVDVAVLEQAMQALDVGQVDNAKALLQNSIEEAVSDLMPATGQETGTTVILPALPGRGDLSGRDWSFLGTSVLCLLLGALLAYRFRPADTVGELRSRLAGSR